ncbi:MAG TPA: M28 family peptidase [Solirubrobacteraceae bacterium]|jgi:hypothetical protein
MPPDPDRLRATVEHLQAIERPSASPGERAAAEWIAARLRDEGLDARIEVERAHGTYWVPLGLLTAAAGLAGLGRRRGLAALVGAAAAAGIADDVSGGPHLLRKLLPQCDTFNVVAEAGDPDAAETLVFVAHHDAAHGGFIFDPRFVTAVADRFPDWYDRQETSPQVMQVVAGGPALVALGALTRIRALRALGTFVALGSAAAFADIARSPVVPGANDNLTAVAVVLELARLLREQPVRGVRVLLVSTGSEESFMEGMRGFVRRHRAALDPARTRVVCVESVGAPELIVIEGEGMIRMRDYPPAARELIADAAARAGLPIRRGLRLGLATDGLIALLAGYPTATLASVTKYKVPANYHQPYDVAANVDWETVRRATAVCEEIVRGLAA